MKTKISGALIVIIILATFLAGWATYPVIGNARLAFGLPAALVVLYGLWALLPAVDPIAKGFPGFRYVYDFFWILLTAVLAYAYALELGVKLGWQVNILHAVIPVVAALIVIVGTLLPKIRRNWFFGIRTPWTLSSDEVWHETHRFGRPIFIAAGVIILGGLFVPRDWSIGFIFAPTIIASLIAVVYSYIVFQKSKRNSN